MRLVFTKGSGKFDLMDVVRADGTAERVQCPKQRIIPHDMVHYAVEHTLKRRGFLGRVKDGEAAGFKMKAEQESDSIERLVEVFQGDAWSTGRTPASEMIDLYAVTCAARSCPALPVDEKTIEDVREAISAITRQWEVIAVGKSLVLAM
jgi:hypothetical protein